MTFEGGTELARPDAGGSAAGKTELTDPKALSSAGDAATQLSGRIRAAGRHGEDTVDRAASSLSGSSWGGELGRALRKADQQWTKKSDSLSRDCGSFGEKCTSTGRNFRQTESANSGFYSEDYLRMRRDFG